MKNLIKNWSVFLLLIIFASKLYGFNDWQFYVCIVLIAFYVDDLFTYEEE